MPHRDEMNGAFFVSLLDGLEDPVFVKDQDSRWIFTNQAFQKLLGHDDLIGKTDRDIFPEEQYTEFYAGDRYVFENHKSLTQEESIGEDTWALVKKSPIALPDGKMGILGIIIDITEYRSMRIEIEGLRYAKRQALHDPLTDLANRRHLEEHFLELQAEHRSRGSFVLMHLDLDGFKPINDQHGHAAGDAALVHVARNLTSILDTSMFAARIGGDEFVVLGSDFRSLGDAQQWGERAIAKVAEPLEFGGKELSVGASIGIAQVRDVRFDLDALLAAADVALYIAKENGRNQVQVYTPEIGKNLKVEQSEKDRAHADLTIGAFVPYYQPQIDLKTGALVGIEALARWNHPKHGVLSPADFIRFFAGEHMLDQLDIAILDQALDDTARLRQQGHEIGKVAVNISSNLALRPDMLDIIRPRVPRDFTLALELSEALSFEELDHATKMQLDALRELGCDIEIDDFGSSQASILGVIALGPDRIKIDKGIILPMIEFEANLLVVKSIMQIAKALNVAVIAEGVETQAHVDALSELGCQIGQGFTFAKPLPFDELVAYLDAGAEVGQPWRALNQ